MKGHPKVLDALNALLADELTAIGQYMVHSEMCDDWGYARLHQAIDAQARDEMHHAEWLIKRILFLDGVPLVSKLNAMRIGQSVPDIVGSDQDAELDAVKAYNAAIGLAREARDQGTADLLERILEMEEGHLDWGEQQRGQIEQMGLAQYLSTQVGGSA